MPIRVLHFIGQLGVGGCEKQLLGLCRRIDRERFEFGVCYYAPDPDGMVQEFEAAGARLFHVNKFGGISKPRFFLQLRCFVRDFRPDIIHTWQYSANVWGRMAGLTCGYRRFISSERTARPHLWPIRVFERVLGRRTTWTANTQAVATWISRSIGVPHSEIRVIHNAVEMPEMDRDACRAEVRAELGLEPGTPIILTVGRQAPAKNYPMFYRVARRVIQEWPQAVFISAGHGILEDTLRKLHADMQLGKSVRMLGLRHDVPQLLAAADVFCLCSNWEGFPNVLVEAMASGVPAVTTDFAGVEEVINDGQERLAVVVERERDDQMAEQILDLLADPGRRQSLGQAGKASVTARFSWGRLLEQMEDLYLTYVNDPQALPGGACCGLGKAAQ